ncbi:MAG: hypothetical protein ACO3ND_07715 [Opitutales bacterium]
MSPTITNLHNLPEALVAAVRNDPYTGGGDISVTKLIDAPQRRALWRQHQDAIEEDVSERIWSLLGQAVHHILERAGTDTLVEQRLFAEMAGWTISGQFDRLHLSSKTLSDYKVTTTYKAKGDDNWTRQLNILRWLAFQNNLEVDRLEIVAIFRDFRRSEAERNPDYPQQAVKVIEIPVWSLDETAEYIRERVLLHQAAQAGDPAPCTDEERWYSGDKWALMKPGGKRALRVLEEKPDFVPDGTILEHRPGRYRRCEQYCEVAPWCAQWQADLTLQETYATDR